MENNRTFLEKLLDGAEVEWKPLWSITTWDKKFNAVEKEKQPKVIKYHYYLASELKPLIVDGGDVKLLTTNESDIWTTEELVQNNISEGEIIAIPWGGNPIVQYYKGKFVTADNRIATSNNTKILDNKFLYYFLLSKLDVISSFYRGSGIKHPSMYHILEMLIPIPPLPVQTEIVKILDALTALTSELTSELTLRRKQYEYYREKLLSEEELGKVGFKWKTLEELVEKTQNIRWKNNTKTYRYIDLTSVDRENNNITGTIEINALNAPSRAQKIVKENDVIFATTRPTQQRIALISKEFSNEIASTGYCVLRAKTNIVLPKWLFYFLSTINFKNYVEENQSGSAYPAISDSKIKEFRIPVPEVTIQQNIIEKLDKFYSLTNSLLHGLPKEINNRTKQYSYYQKELLNFLGREIYE